MTPGQASRPSRLDPFCSGAAWRYGLMGLPLAFVALPLYVIFPNHYTREWGLSLGTLGALLLGARLLDALTDPLWGRWVDCLFARSAHSVLQACGVAAVLLALGFAALFFPFAFPVIGQIRPSEPALLAWAAVALVLTYGAYSFLTIAHQSWAAQHGGSDVQRSRLMGWREGLALVGVMVASVLPLTLGLAATAWVLALALAVAWVAWRAAPKPGRARPEPGRATPELGRAAPHSNVTTGDVATVTHATLSPASERSSTPLFRPWASPAFRRLLGIFMLSGIASAVPATLVLFFIEDRLRAPASWQPAFLGVYFLCAALAVPLWIRAVPRWGLARCWLAGMVLAMAVFAWAAQLQAGDHIAFLVICALSGAALGADLALPSALLSGVIAQAGDRGRAEGAYFGWWNFASKLNLALSAGLVLPALALWGYAPGTSDPAALNALSWAYCALPCALKALAAGCLYSFEIRKPL